MAGTNREPTHRLESWSGTVKPCSCATVDGLTPVKTVPAQVYTCAPESQASCAMRCKARRSPRRERGHPVRGCPVRSPANRLSDTTRVGRDPRGPRTSRSKSRDEHGPTVLYDSARGAGGSAEPLSDALIAPGAGSGTPPRGSFARLAGRRRVGSVRARCLRRHGATVDEPGRGRPEPGPQGPGRNPFQRARAADRWWRERRGVLVERRRSADFSGAHGRGLRSDLHDGGRTNPSRSHTSSPRARARRRARTSCPATSRSSTPRPTSAATRARPSRTTPRATSGRSTTYDIFKASADGSGVAAAHHAARATTPKARSARKDGTIVFTSVARRRHRALPHGHGRQERAAPHEHARLRRRRVLQRRLHEDRLARVAPEAGQGARRLPAAARARAWCGPRKLELYVANADGTDARQITYLNAASFAPFFTPAGDRILFSSNYGDPKGREFDIWAVNVDGTELERITYGRRLRRLPDVLARRQAPRVLVQPRHAPRHARHERVRRELGGEPGPSPRTETAADRMMSDVTWLADPAREGRGVGTQGLDASGEYIEARFKALGLQPAGQTGTLSPGPEVVTSVKPGAGTRLHDRRHGARRRPVHAARLSAHRARSRGGWCSPATASTSRPSAAPTTKACDSRARSWSCAASFRSPRSSRTPRTSAATATCATRPGAHANAERPALVVVDTPEKPKDAPASWSAPEEATFPALEPDSYGDAGIPVVVVKRAAFASTLAQLEKGQRVDAKLGVELDAGAPARVQRARAPAGACAGRPAPGGCHRRGCTLRPPRARWLVITRPRQPLPARRSGRQCLGRRTGARSRRAL